MRNYQYNSMTIGQYSSRRKGQALLFVFFLLLIVGILGGALFVMWQAEIKTRGAEKKGLIAFYLAQAGIERAKVEVLNNVSLSGNSLDFADLDTAGDNYNFYYNFSVSISGTQRDITGRGFVYERKPDGSNGVLLAHREIAVTINGILDLWDNTTHHPPKDGIDDDLSGSIVSYSWHEE